MSVTGLRLYIGASFSNALSSSSFIRGGPHTHTFAIRLADFPSFSTFCW